MSRLLMEPVLLRHNRQLLLLHPTHGMAAINKNLHRYLTTKYGRTDLVGLTTSLLYCHPIDGLSQAWINGISMDFSIHIPQEL